MCFDFGRAADRLLAYQTDRVVRLKHARVGCLYYSLVLLVLFYIVGVQLLYQNSQFDKREVSGTPRLSIQQPTVAGCNPRKRACKDDFSSFAALPYCNVYAGNRSGAADVQKGCMIADRHTLLPNGALGASMLVPTSIDRTTEACGADLEANGTCSDLRQRRVVTGQRYVADIERFSVMVSHSYRRDTMSGNNNRVLGYYQECIEHRDAAQQVSTAVFGVAACPGQVAHRPIECLDASCHFAPPGDAAPAAAGFLQRQRGEAPARRGGAADSGNGSGGGALSSPGNGRAWQLLEDGVFALPDGDVFTVKKLLELAGVASLDEAKTLDGRPLREQGTVVEIVVHYTNLYPFASSFGRKDVSYEYTVSLQPSHIAGNEIIAVSADDGSKRVIESRHGIHFTVKIEGSFGFFSIVNLLLALAEGAALLTVATVLTDKIAVYLMQDADDNYHAKYKEVRRAIAASDGEESGLDSEGVASSSGRRD